MRNRTRFHAPLAILFTVLLASSGCSSPKNFEVKSLTENQKKQIGQKLTADEGQKLAAWMLRNAIGGKEIPAGVTVDQALRDQDAWEITRKNEEAQAEALKKRVEAERKEKQEEFAKLLSVAVVSKRNSTGEFDQRMVLLDVAFENKGTKDIAGAKCVLAITDMFGDKILNLNWSFDDGVAAGKTYVERGSGVKINQFLENHMKLWASDMDKLRFKVEIQTIMFKDGTSVKAPE